MNDDFKKLEKNISRLLKKSFKEYSNQTKEFWEKAENAEKIAKDVSIELRLMKKESKNMNQKLNAFIIFFIIFFLLILFYP